MEKTTEEIKTNSPSDKRFVRTFPCPRCSFSSKRAAATERHVASEHGDPAVVYAEDVLRLQVRPTCTCGCGEQLPFRSWRDGYAELIRGHKVPLTPEQSTARRASVSATRAKNIAAGKYSGVSFWKGKTKENDPAVAARAERSGEKLREHYATHDHWSKGLTKETDERIARTAARSREQFANGERTPWSKGLNAQTDERLAALSVSVRAAVNLPGVQTALSEKKRLPERKIAERIASIEHKFEILGRDTSYDRASTYSISVKCRQCGNVDTKTLLGLTAWCRCCDKSGSIAESEVRDYIRSLGFHPIQTRSIIAPYELDAFVAERNFAVEYNGLWWHCEARSSDPNRHQKKTDLAAEKGVSILHVFQDEWRDKRAIVESMIRHRLGLSGHRLSARDCRVVELDAADRRAFFEANHLDGDVPSLCTLGLLHPTHGLVGALSLRHPYTQAPEAAGGLEIARSASLVGFAVRGGLGRLVARAREIAALRGAAKLLTYADERVGRGVSYERAGFARLRKTGPRFWWTDGEQRFGRLTVRADRARGMSEAEVAEERGVWRVWCCGNSLMKLDC